MRALRNLIFPEGILVVAALVATLVPSLTAVVDGAAGSALAIALAIGGLLSLRFHRGRILLVLLLLGLADRVLAFGAVPPSAADRAASAFLALLLPINVVVLALLPERGALSTAGLVRLGAIAAQSLLAVALVAGGDATIVAALELPLVPALGTGWSAAPQLALGVAAAALLFFLVLWVREPSPVARGLLWALVATTMAFHVGRPPESTVWFAAAALVLTLAVIESSYALAFHDGLTGLPARRAFNEALHEPGDRYAVAMVDVDLFKHCNDRWGHDVGDQVLRMVAAKLDEVGGEGRAFRYGGEEFALLFPGLGILEAREHCEALRAAVEDASFAVRHRPRPRRNAAQQRGTGKKGEEIAVTISIGLAEGAATSKADAVIRAADQALYRAKANGRNRVEG